MSVSQQRFYVKRDVVDLLVYHFMLSKKGREKRYCASFNAAGLEAALRALPGTVVAPSFPGEQHVDFHAAMRTLEEFRCSKMSAYCDSWTPWMRHRLNEAKRRV